MYGLNFLLSVADRLKLDRSIVKEVLHALFKIHYYEQQGLHQIPEDEDLSEE